MLSKKNTHLLIILSLLVVTTVLLSFFGGNNEGTSIEKHVFSISDTTSINSIIIRVDGSVNTLLKDKNRWVLNDKYSVDEYLRNVLFAVINRVEVKRAVAKKQKKFIEQQLSNESIEVTVIGDGFEYSFLAGGNSNKTTSYFMLADEQQPYIVNLPGYTSYVSGIFELSENQWRDKLIASSHWTSIKKIDVLYSNNSEKNYQIKFDKNMLGMSGLESYDTTAMMDYTRIFEELRADAFFNQGDNEILDSLINTEPIVEIIIEDLDETKNNRFNIYPAHSELNFHPIIIGDDQRAALNNQIVKAILKESGDFE